MTNLSSESLGLNRMAFLQLPSFPVTDRLYSRQLLSKYCMPDIVLRAQG